MTYFLVSVGAVHNDSTVSVVSFDIAGTQKQMSEQQCRHLKGDLTSRESSVVLATGSVGR